MMTASTAARFHARKAALGAAAGMALAALACMPPLPERMPDRALVRDLARVVEVRGGVGWFIDESEFPTVLPDAMKSACQVTPETIVSSLTWLDQEIARQGGDVEKAWRERGKDLDKVSDLLRLTRVRLVLRRAEGWVLAGRCPFWIEPSPRFAGVHTEGRRLVLTVEGGGRFTEEFALGTVRYGGGGGGRVLLGYGISENWLLSAGPEFGGAAIFTNLALGKQSDLPQLVAQAALPVVLRWHYGLAATAEVEAGPMVYIDKGSADPATGKVQANFDWGIRLGAALGGTYLRLQRGVMPRFSLSFTIDHLPVAVDGKTSLTQIGIGLRTGVDFSSWRNW